MKIGMRFTFQQHNDPKHKARDNGVVKNRAVLKLDEHLTTVYPHTFSGQNANLEEERDHSQTILSLQYQSRAF